MTPRRRPTQADHLAAVRSLLNTGLWHTLPALVEVCQPKGRTAVTLALHDIKEGGGVLEERVVAGVVQVRLDVEAWEARLREAAPVGEMLGVLGAAMMSDPSEPSQLLDVSPVSLANGGLSMPATQPDAGEDREAMSKAIIGKSLAIQDDRFGPDGECLDAFPRAVLCPGSGSGDGCGNVLPCPDHPSVLDRQAGARAQAPGPSSRCAVCDCTFKYHASFAEKIGHPFQPKRRGPPPGPRQRRTPGPMVDVVPAGRVEYERAAAPVASVPAAPDASRKEDMNTDESDPKRSRFWSPSRGIGWLTWGEVCPSTPTHFEPDDGPAIEWIWTECGCGKPGEKMPRGKAALAEWMAWEHFVTEGGETLVFRRAGPPGVAASPVQIHAVTKSGNERLAADPLTQALCGPLRPVSEGCLVECHYLSIHEPARLTDAQAVGVTLCPAHRRWVEGARAGRVC